MFPNSLLNDAESLLETLRQHSLKVATIESCTGGLVAGVLTAIAGSSDVMERGWVTYSNEGKEQQVGVPSALIAEHGAVSVEVAKAMAEGGLTHSPADIAVSVTGIAGPGGGSTSKPVGLVCFGLARKGYPTLTHREVFPGDRAAIRMVSVIKALQLIRQAI